MKLMVAIFILAVSLYGCAVIDTGGKDLHSNNNNVTREAQNIENVVNGELSYTEITGKIYTNEEVLRIYEPNLEAQARSHTKSLKNIMELIEVHCIRQCEIGYYVVFKMENSTLITFFDTRQMLLGMFNLSHSPINDISELNKLKWKSFGRVLLVDPSTLLSNQARVSEHILSDFSTVIINYKRTLVGTYVNSVEKYNGLYPDAEKYVRYLLPIDFPENYHPAEK